MNPYLKIKKSEGIKFNKNSPYYGRFILSFNQVFPFREPTYNRALVKIRNECVGDAKLIYDLIPEHIFLFQLHKQSDIKNNKYIQIDCFNDNDYFFEISLYSDFIYIAMENFYFTLLELCPYLENFRFFAYSRGDNDDRWMDEYINLNGELNCNRFYCKKEIYYGRILFYIEIAESNLDNKEFILFTTWQLYDNLKSFLNTRSRKQDPAEEKIFIKLCNNEILLIQFYNYLKNIFHSLLNLNNEGNKYSNLQKEFSNWCSAKL